MKRLVKFSLDQGGSVLVEVDGPPAGPVTRGVGSGRSTVVAKADETFECASAVVSPAAWSLLARLRSFEDPPDGVGIECGVRPRAQSGAFVAAVAAEASFTVPLTWRRRGDSGE